jgi:hypothetical protein
MADGAACNTVLVGHHGDQAGLKVARYVDPAGHECAYYDTEVTFPLGGPLSGEPVRSGQSGQFGTYVLDMADPSNPVLTEALQTPAMLSPHESMLVNQKRGLLAAVMGNAAFYPGFLDVYDLSADCRHPKLLSSSPTGILGHESGWAPDGLTFYAASLAGGTITAVDLTDPSNPVPVWIGNYFSHGLSVSDDGNRAYVATSGVGLTILDTSEVQARKTNPQVTVVSQLTWPQLSVPQIAWPVTIHGHPFVIEQDEFGAAGAQGPGVGRIIDIADEKHPAVISNIRLEVHMPEHQAEQANDPGAWNTGTGGYAGHYCEVPRRVDPEVVACTFILSGMRLFDIRDPYHPRELAYYNAPLPPNKPLGNGNYAMSNVVFVPERSEIWYTDVASGFYAVRVTNGVWPMRPAGAQFYFAEGSTLDGFHEYLLLSNPTNAPATTAVTYFFDDGASPKETSVIVPAESRVTVDVADSVGAGHGGVSIGVASTGTIVAERALYFARAFSPGFIDGVHGVLGAQAPRNSWSFAEGSTLAGFQEFLTFQNPGSAPAVAQVTFGPTAASNKTISVAIPAGQRRTIDVNTELGPDVVGHSTEVRSDNPIVVERPMYFSRAVGDDGSVIDGGHDAFGATPATVWRFAEGTVLDGFSEYLTVGNPGAAPVKAVITYLMTDGTSLARAVTVAAGSRTTVRVFDPADPAGIGRSVSDAVSRGVGAVVVGEAPIVVERPLYFHHDFGDGEVDGGAVTAGAPAPALRWDFAEGSTLEGIRPYLTIVNGTATTAEVTITFATGAEPVSRQLKVPPTARTTVVVNGDPAQGGLGATVTGFGIAVESSVPIVVERSEYVRRLIPGLGAEPVTGGTTVLGAPS